MAPKTAINRIHFGRDARNLKEIVAGFRPQAIITSPPYLDLKDYGPENQIGGRNMSEFLAELEKVFKACYDVLADDGTLWIVTDSLKRDGRMIPLPFELARRLEGIGFLLQDVVIWRKDKTLPYSSPGRFRNLFEYIHVYSKSKKFKFRAHRAAVRHKSPTRLEKRGLEKDGSGEARFLRGWPERYSPLGANPGNVWEFPIPVQGIWNPEKDESGEGFIHFCPFPQGLIKRIIDIATDPGDLVADPFSGSGSVPAQAEVMGRKFLGIELNKDFERAYRITRGMFHRQWADEVSIRKAELEDRLFEGDLILRLRVLKHAGVWTRLIRARLGGGQTRNGASHQFLGMISICEVPFKEILTRAIQSAESRVNIEVPVRISLVFQNLRNADQATKECVDLLGERGLRKYGLDLKVQAIDISKVQRQRDLPSQLHAYNPTRWYNAFKEFDLRKEPLAFAVLPQPCVVSNISAGIVKKVNVIEDTMRRFLQKMCDESVKRLGSESAAAEFLGVTPNELRGLRTPSAN